MTWHSSMDLPPLAAEEKVSDPGSGVGISAIFPFDLFGRGALCLFLALAQSGFSGQRSDPVFKTLGGDFFNRKLHLNPHGISHIKPYHSI